VTYTLTYTISQCEKAITCVQEAELSSSSCSKHGEKISSETFTFAKFSIYCRSSDETSAGQMLTKLIAETHSFDMALNAVIMFLRGVGIAHMIIPLNYLDFFQNLSQRFQRYNLYLNTTLS
jgi:hypothetical protein